MSSQRAGSTSPREPQHGRRYRRAAKLTLYALLAYVAVAYLVLPVFWLLNEQRRAAGPEFLTSTVDDLAGDPINIALVGSKQDVIHAFAAAGWNAADPVTLKSSAEIGVDVVLDRPYRDAPISTLIYEGRRQDLAFERPAGASPDTRHHVRLWQSPTSTVDGRAIWYAAASYDRGVGISHFTGEITHHIGPDLDAERAFVVIGLENAGRVVSSEMIEGIGATTDGVNGGGDRYFTDGMIRRAVLRP